ncbi:MAG: Succinyl-CoA ligase [ADP-forming] subunit alpha [Candidatus Heimdallarchaeota archaeon LC_3]|nr:MAG: Succinyl-CoA ligase [ADP-forming] subunit alpha [Candidatus Heimdallarchaeota archaeon LC_3]
MKSPSLYSNELVNEENNKKIVNHFDNWEKILNPRSIAIIGASEISGKLAERRTKSLLNGNFEGKIFLINPKRAFIFNRKAYSSILDVEEVIDLVMIVIPVEFISKAVKDCITKGVKGIVIMTAGFREAGEKGKLLEQEIISLASHNGVRIMGPNSNGIFSASGKMNLLGVPNIAFGPLSIIAQSGNIIVSLTHYAERRSIGINKIISAGNAQGIELSEIIEYLNNDPGTKVIILYIEEIRNGVKFLEAARACVKDKPIVALKIGSSSSGRRSALSHTGSLTGDEIIVNAAFKQAGIIRVHNVDELIDVATSLANLPHPKRNNVAIISEGGGDFTVAADNAERYGLKLPIISKKSQDLIRPLVLKGVSIVNPIDYGASAEEHPEDIHKIVEILMKEEIIDSIFITGFFGGYEQIIASHIGKQEKETSQKLIELMSQYQKPIIVHSSFGEEAVEALRILKKNNIFVSSSSERAMQCLASITHYSLRKKQLAKAKKIINTKMASKLTILSQDREFQRLNNPNEFIIRELLQRHQIEISKHYLVNTIEEAVEKAKKIGFPVVCKVVTSPIIHKSDIGGVKLHLHTVENVRKAFTEIYERVGKFVSREYIQGVLITAMAPKGIECIIGLKRDPQFGQVVLFGLGGIYVEVIKDVSIKVLPLTDLDLEEIITELKCYPLFTGIRGQESVNIEKIKKLILDLVNFFLIYPEIKEMDLNPVIFHKNGFTIVDARILTF